MGTTELKELKGRQELLGPETIEYSLDGEWNSDEFMTTLRDQICRLLPRGIYDPQDLEHQSLFRLTTFDPSAITEDVVEWCINEQYAIMLDRLSRIDIDLEYVFRGLSGKSKDLNVYHRLRLSQGRNGLEAKNDNYSIPVRFERVMDERVIDFFLGKLHYIHYPRSSGEAWGLFFGDDQLPFAIKAIEPSTVVKEYKRDALLAHGIHPDKAVEITRYYTLPGSPTNSISITNSLLVDHYRSTGTQAIMTTTMPSYSKTKSSTIAGGMNRILLTKDTVHRFVPNPTVTVGGKVCYQHVTRTYIQQNPSEVVITNHPKFNLLPTVEVYKIINKLEIQPLPFVKEGRVIYVRNRS